VAGGAGPWWEFAALGPVDARSPLGAIHARPKSRDLLALLLVRANQVVRTDQLVEELWEGSPPGTAVTAIRVHVAHLRQAFAQVAGDDAPEAVRYTNGGYQLVVEAGAFDVDRFEAGLRDGRSALASGAPREAIEHLGGAIRLWRGAPYQDVELLEPIQREADRLRNLRVGALELLADAHLGIGQPALVCELLEPELRDDPLRETVAERLMLAQYRSGRAVDALRVCARVREALDEELGVAPGPSLVELEKRIIVGAPELDVPRERSAPRSTVQRKSAPFVGRRIEARELDEAWKAVSEGETRVVLISGGAGIGKTALAGQLATRVAAEGATVLKGHCDPDPVADVQPFPHLVREAVRRVPPSALTEPMLGDLARLVPDLAEDRPPLPAAAEPATGRRRLFAAVTRLLDACPAPMLLVLEDLHWADAGAIALLRFVIRERRHPFLLVLTYRDDEVRPDTPFGAALATEELAEPDLRVHLHGLDVAELTALLDMLAPELEGPVDVATLSELTGGNPLFAREVIRELLAGPNDVPLAELAPDGIRTLVGHQLQRLSPEAREVVLVASILGSEFSLTLLAATAEMAETAVLAALDEALATRLVTETDALDVFTFSHPLVRNFISTSMPAHRRARLHERAAAFLELRTTRTSPSDVRWAELARHALAALPLGDGARAAGFAKRAGDDAAASFAYDDAAAWYRAALDAGDGSEWTGDERAGTLLELGRALERGGHLQEARAVYLQAVDATREAGNASLFADVAIAATSRYLTIDEFSAVQRELTDEALEGVIDDRRRVELLSEGAKLRYYDDGDADQPYAEAAIELASRSDDPWVRAIGMLAYHRFLTKDPGAAEERVVLCRDLLTLCEDESLHGLVGVAARELLADLLCVGWFEEFDAELTHFDAIAAAHDVPADKYWASALRATRSLMTDAGGDAEGMVRAAAVLGAELQQVDASGMEILQLFALRRRQGRCHEVVPGLVAPAEDQPRMEAGISLLACSSLESGRPEDARRIVDQVLAGGEVRFPRNNMRLAAIGLVAGVVAQVGTDEQRELCRRELERYAEQWCVFGSGGAVFGTGHHWLGELAAASGDVAAARRHLLRALELSEAAASPSWAEQAQTALDRLDAAG
jgi:DNA-binding SARP family transcriptional activator/tetratricopeptide (TPR) repeat protein